MDIKNKKATSARPTLSVCMIVKDEEKMLPECLRSVKDVMDELIIVDTGSTDNTVAIAEEFGAKVYHHPWQRDFSLHRNQSIGYATCDWILQIDADERLDEASQALLQKQLRKAPKDVNGFWTVIQDYTKDNVQSVRFNYPRLFRNHIGVSYESIVHNQVKIPGRLVYTEIRLNHFGYDLDRKTMLRKFRRSVTLLKKQIREQPDNPSPYYYLANAYSQYKRHAKAVEYAKKTLSILRMQNKAHEVYLSIYYVLISGYYALEQFDEAERTCHEAIKVRPKYVDAYYHLSRLYYMQKKFDKAIQLAEKYLELSDWYNADASRISSVNFFTLDKQFRLKFWKALSHFSLGQQQKAFQVLDQALAEDERDIRLSIETIHNSLAVVSPEVAEEIISRIYRRYKIDSSFFFQFIQELALVDLMTIAAKLINGSPPEWEKENAFADMILLLMQEQPEKLTSFLSDLPADSEYVDHAEMLDIILAIERTGSAPNLEEKSQSLQQLALIRAYSSLVLHHVPAQIDQETINMFVNDNAEAEFQLIAQFQMLLQSIVDNNVESVVQCINSLIQILEIDEDVVLEDIEQLKPLLVKMAEKCDGKLFPEAGDFAIALAEQFFPDDPIFLSFKYHRTIRRSKRQGPYSGVLRLYFKHLMLPKRKWLDQSQLSTRKPVEDALVLH